MPGFKESITVNKEIFVFEFTEVFNPSGSKYFVAVHNGFNQITSFEMKKTLSSWNIVPPAPDWANDLQELLTRAIADNNHK